jgi:hypothetical protein
MLRSVALLWLLCFQRRLLVRLARARQATLVRVLELLPVGLQTGRWVLQPQLIDRRFQVQLGRKDAVFVVGSIVRQPAEKKEDVSFVVSSLVCFELPGSIRWLLVAHAELIVVMPALLRYLLCAPN